MRLGANTATPTPVANPGQHYAYGVESLALGANASAAPQFQIVNNDFQATFLTAISTGKFKCRIKVGSRYLSNIQLHSDTHFGTAQAPLPLLVPLTLKKGDIVSFELTDLSGAQNDIRIALIGAEV